MTGVKGKSGGARPGAGRKRKSGENMPASQQGQSVPVGELDMLQLLQDVALGRVEATSLQVRAAIAAVQYTHVKKHDGGKKDDVARRAKKVSNKFAPATPPKLVAVGGALQ